MSTDSSAAGEKETEDGPLRNRVDSFDFEFSPQAINMSSAILSQAEESDLNHGRAAVDLEAACLYLGAKINGLPIQASEIKDGYAEADPSVLRTARQLNKKLELNIPPADPRTYAERFCDELDASEDLLDQALDLLDICEDANRASGSPTGIAAGAVYAASRIVGEKRTQRTISIVADVSEVTIRNRYKEQLELYEEAESDTSS